MLIKKKDYFLRNKKKLVENLDKLLGKAIENKEHMNILFWDREVIGWNNILIAIVGIGKNTSLLDQNGIKGTIYIGSKEGFLMKTWMLEIKDKFAAANIFLVSLVVLSGFSFKYSAQNMQGLTVVGDGLQTCFNRVQQSFTARLLGQGGSNYLDTDFLVNTENCFGE